jgi:hypothetical protein
MLIIHSALVSWLARFLALSSLMSTVVVFSPATFGRRADVVADRADGDVVLARLQPVLREAVAALRVGGDADLDDRARLLGADDDAFHRAFLRGADHAGQRRLALREREM